MKTDLEISKALLLYIDDQRKRNECLRQALEKMQHHIEDIKQRHHGFIHGDGI